MLLNRNVRGASGEVLDGNEKRVIGNWKKDNPYYKMTEFLAEVYFVGWKLSLVSSTLGYFCGNISVEEISKISKPSGKGAPWVLLAAYSKI